MELAHAPATGAAAASTRAQAHKQYVSLCYIILYMCRASWCEIYGNRISIRDMVADTYNNRIYAGYIVESVQGPGGLIRGHTHSHSRLVTADT